MFWDSLGAFRVLYCVVGDFVWYFGLFWAFALTGCDLGLKFGVAGIPGFWVCWLLGSGLEVLFCAGFVFVGRF